MRAAAVAAALLLPESSASHDEQRHARIMDEIERKVRLPAGAERLDSYARSYAPGAHGKVVGTYVIPRKAEVRPTGRARK
jgi:hypothetical protein